MNYKTTIMINGKNIPTLSDILPPNGKLDILIIAKTPANISVEAGHYFQGQQGTMFWNRMREYGILNFPFGKYADNYLIENKFGITDIVKVPRDYGNEPLDIEYKEGLSRILSLIKKYDPKVILFVYKKVLDKMIDLNYGIKTKSKYGFNADLEKHFNSKIFVFPMPGTPCTREVAETSMTELKNIISKIKN